MAEVGAMNSTRYLTFLLNSREGVWWDWGQAAAARKHRTPDTLLQISGKGSVSGHKARESRSARDDATLPSRPSQCGELDSPVAWYFFSRGTGGGTGVWQDLLNVSTEMAL